MQKILIIGNGFDLHHCLPTKYEHFVGVLQSVENLKDDLSEYSFGQIFEKINQNYKNRIENSYNTENIKYSRSNILELKELIESNNWYHTFKHITEIDTWIDFETQIEIILNIVLRFFQKVDQFIKSQTSTRDIQIGAGKYVASNQGFAVNTNEFKILSNIGLLVGKNLNPKLLDSKYLLVQDLLSYAIDEKKILDDLSESLNQFIQIFNRYFTDIVGPFYDNYKELELIKDSQGKNITIETTNLSDNFPSKSQFKFNSIYSFNYTETLQKFYKTKEINYLHGHIGNNSNMVLGVSDIDDELKKHKMFSFTKYYQKLYKDTDYNFFDVNSLNFSPTQIYVWGHSLDKSDSEYISIIIASLGDTNNICNVVVFFHDDYARASQLQNLLSICGKELIEKAMKGGKLIFKKSNNNNLLEMIKSTKLHNEFPANYSLM